MKCGKNVTNLGSLFITYINFHNNQKVFDLAFPNQIIFFQFYTDLV